MNPYKILKKLGKILRGGITAKQVFLGLTFGFIIGMIPGVNLTLLLLILLMLLFNSNISSAILAFGIGKTVSILLASITFNIGYFLIHNCGLDGLFKTILNLPVIAYFNLHIYCLIGGLLVGVLLGIPFAWGVSSLLEVLRKKILDLKQTNEKVNKASTSKITRLVLWFIFGSQKAALDASIGVETGWFNIKRTIAIMVIFIVWGVGTYFFLNPIAKCIFISSLEKMNGAEVNVANFDMSFSKGSIIIDKLEVAERKNPQQNRFTVDKLVFDIDMSKLLCKQILVTSIECDRILTKQQRQEVAKVYKKDQDLTDDEKKLEEDTDSIFNFPEIKSIEDLKIYQEKYDSLNSYFNKIKEFINKQASKKDASKEDEKQRQKALAKQNKSYLKLSASEFLTKHPSWEIVLCKVGNIQVAPKAPEISVIMKHISNDATLATGEFEFKLDFDKSKLQDYVKNQIQESEAYKKGKEKVDAETKRAEEKVDKEIERLEQKITDKLGEKAGSDATKAVEDVKEGLKNLFKKK